MRVRVKICGITNREDAWAAVEAGADALGFVFAPSLRQVTPAQAGAIIAALPPFVTTVGVVVDQDVTAILRECPLDAVQFHGQEPPEALAAVPGVRRIRALRLRSVEELAGLAQYAGVAHAFLLDSYVEGRAGGTGAPFAWELAAGADLPRPLILAGGLTPENVAAAIRQVRPYAVDVSSGVEAAPGRKDAARLRAFLDAVRALE
jgi:phosphoribosylanthranilate isomerase